jgi:hypothetical protein
LALGLIVAGCASLQGGTGASRPSHGPDASKGMSPAGALPGMPPPLDPNDVYAADRPGRLSPAVRRFPARVYVPNSQSDTVDVIDQRTYRIVRHFATGWLPQHVTPSWDLRTLWVGNNQGNSLTAIDLATGRRAIVVAERLRRLDFRDPHTMRLRHALPVPCQGIDHMDFSADGRYLLASCEFSGELVRVDVALERVVGVVGLRAGLMPQDVKLAPDGGVFYVADMTSDGVWVIDAAQPRVLGFVPTGKGAHGLYASRDSRVLYVSNRGEGSVSLISFATRRVVATWRPPGGAALTWVSPPTAGCCGCRAATTPRCTRSTPATGGCWPASRSAGAPTACASTRSRAATPSATRESSASARMPRFSHYSECVGTLVVLARRLAHGADRPVGRQAAVDDEEGRWRSRRDPSRGMGIAEHVGGIGAGGTKAAEILRRGRGG